MEQLRKTIYDDLRVNKPIVLTESVFHTFVFEVEKSEGDECIRKIKETYKIISVKNRIM